MQDYDPAVRTRLLARIAGPYLIVLAVTLFVRQAVLPLILPAFMQDAPLVLTAGAFTLMVGLTIIALHHHWTGAAAIAISLIGAATAIKGAMLMIAPELGAALAAAVVRTPFAVLIVAVVVFVVGIWLSLAGWRARS